MDKNKKQYRQIDVKIYLTRQDDVVRTSNGAELDYQQQSWGSSTQGFDKPFN